jgi:DNA-binding MarR family transcriptional regulator
MNAAKTDARSTVSGRPTESIFRELVRTFGLLERVMQAHFARFGISGAQWGVLRNLHRAEGEGLPGLRLTDLSDRLLVRPPSVTGAVDRLERAGLVLRRDSTTDLRAKHVSLTAKGRELVERVLVYHGAKIDAVLGGLSPAEQTAMHRLLGRLSRHLEQLVEGTEVAAKVG